MDATFEKEFIRSEMEVLEEKCRGQSGFLCESQAFFVESVLWIVYDFKAWSEGTVRDIIGLHSNNEGGVGALEEQLVRAIGAQLLEPLEYLHNQVGRIFRDLRCKNLMVTSEGRVQLQIFTLPSILQEKAPIYKDSLLWASPELLLQERVPGASMTSAMALNAVSTSVGSPVDVWALGMTLLELALGDPPFSPDLSPSQLFQAIVEGEPPSIPAEFSHLWSKGFKEVIAMCLTRDASQRATIAELKAHPFFAGAPGPDFIVQHLLAPLPPIESRWKLISQIRESQEAASKERQAFLLAQQQQQLSSHLQSLHIPTNGGATPAIGTPQMSHSHSVSSSISGSNNGSVNGAVVVGGGGGAGGANVMNASTTALPPSSGTPSNLTSPVQSPPHTSMLSSASQPPMSAGNNDFLPSSPTHSAPQFSLSTPEMPSFDAPGMGPSLNLGVVGSGPSLNVSGGGGNGGGGSGNGGPSLNLGPSLNMAGIGSGPSLNDPSIHVGGSNNNNGGAMGPSLGSASNPSLDTSSAVNNGSGSGFTPRSSSQTPVPNAAPNGLNVSSSSSSSQQQQQQQQQQPGQQGSSSSVAPGSSASSDNPFLFETAANYAKQQLLHHQQQQQQQMGSGTSTPIQGGQGTPRGHDSRSSSSTATNASNAAAALAAASAINGAAAGGMVTSASSSSVPSTNGSEPTRGRFRIVNPGSASTPNASAANGEMGGSAPSSSASDMTAAIAAAAAVAAAAAAGGVHLAKQPSIASSSSSAASVPSYTITQETPHFQLPPTPTVYGGYPTGAGGGGYMAGYGAGGAGGVAGGYHQPHMHSRRNSKSHLSNVYRGPQGQGNVPSASVVGGVSSSVVDASNVASSFHHQTGGASSPAPLPIQTPAYNVPIEAFLGENERDYFVVFRAIPGTMVSVSLEGRTLVISGQIPPLPVTVLKYIQSIDRPASKFERRIPLPGEIDSTDVDKEIIRESNIMVIRVKKCPKSIHIGDDMF